MPKKAKPVSKARPSRAKQQQAIKDARASARAGREAAEKVLRDRRRK